MDLTSTTVQGFTAAAAEQGVGPPLVCVHGWGANLRYWRHTWPVLVPRFRAMAVDLPGFGRSGKPGDAPYTMDWFVDWLAAWLDARGIARTSLFGHSMGGMISTLFAAKYPERVDRLVLLNPVVQGATALQAKSRIVMKPGILQLFQLGARSTRFLRWAARDFVSVHPMDDEDLVSIRHAAIRALKRSYASLTTTDTTPSAGAITAPTLILNSSDDRIVMPEQGALLEKALPGSKRIVLERLGHCAQLEDPLRVNPAVLAFLEPLPRAFRPRQW